MKKQKGLLGNFLEKPFWDSRIKSANVTGKEMWLGYVFEPADGKRQKKREEGR